MAKLPKCEKCNQSIKALDDFVDDYLNDLNECTTAEELKEMTDHYTADDLATMAVAFGRYIAHTLKANPPGSEDDELMDFADWVGSNDCAQMTIELFGDKK